MHAETHELPETRDGKALLLMESSRCRRVLLPCQWIGHACDLPTHPTGNAVGLITAIPAHLGICKLAFHCLQNLSCYSSPVV
jgi:hypothetical protein